MAQRIKITYGATPSVDLLPAAQRAEVTHEKTLPKLLLALVASAAVAGLIWAAGMIPGFFAQQELDRAQAQQQELSTQIGEYEETQLKLQAVGSRESDRQVVTVPEVLFIELRDALVAALPEGVGIVRYIATLPGGEADSSGVAVATDCVATGVTATVTVSTVAGDGLEQASQFIERAQRIEGFLCGSVVESRVADSGEGTTTETQVRLTFDETVRAGRFAEEASE